MKDTHISVGKPGSRTWFRRRSCGDERVPRVSYTTTNSMHSTCVILRLPWNIVAQDHAKLKEANRR